MASPSLADKYVQRAVTLLRAAEGEAIEVAKEFDKSFDEIVGIIRKKYPDVVRRRDLVTLQILVEKEVERFYQDLFPEELKALAEVAVEKEITWNYQAITGETAKKLSIPKKMEVIKRAAKKTYQGHTFDFWRKKEFSKNLKYIRSIMDQGFVESKSIAEIERDVALLANRSRRDVRTIVRSNFMHNAVEAKEAVFGMNPEVIEGAIWISTLDHRTTPLICGLRDGLLYDNERNPVGGHGIPWDAGPGRIHWNCRSVSAPKIVGVEYTGSRAATEAGENYERGDASTRTGRVRKNHKNARDRGIFKTQQYTTNKKYETWLRQQSNHSIDFVADVLGSKKAARQFRDGEVSLLELAKESPVANPTNRNSL